MGGKHLQALYPQSTFHVPTVAVLTRDGYPLNPSWPALEFS